MSRHKLFILVGIFVIAATPDLVRGETCSLYQKYVKDCGADTVCDGAGTDAGTLCANQNGYFDTTPSGGNGTFYARRVPRCEATGWDFGCGGPNWVRSLDGTRAFYHVDPVPSSTRWVIAFQGGGACGKMSGTTTAVENCADGFSIGANVANHGYFDATLADRTEMTSHHAAGNYTIPSLLTGYGIMSTNAANPFAGYNRVLVDKSSFDRFMGNKTAPIEPYNGDDIVLYFHGRRIISSMIKDLARSTGAFSAGEEVVPNLAYATEVVVVGESGGGGGLIMNMQGIKAKILAVAPEAEVRFVIASRMIPWLEAEAHFDNDPNNGGLWSDNYSGDSDLTTDTGFPPNAVTVTNEYNADTFHSGGVTRNLLESWGDHGSAAYPYLDRSCLDAHPTAEWKCYDEGHVALNHMDEDVFFYQSLFDSVHANNAITWIPISDGVDVESLSGGFFFDPPGTRRFWDEKAERVVYTIDQMYSGHNGAGVLGFYAPDYNNHTAVYTSSFWADTVYVNGLGTESFASYLEYWLGQTWTMGAIADACMTEKYQGGGWVDGYYGGFGDPACQ